LSKKLTETDDLRRRLARLGITKGREFQPKPQHVEGQDIEVLVEGQVIETEAGACYLISRAYAPSTLHGPHRLEEWHHLSAPTLAMLAGDPRLEHVQPGQYIFLDTETTGLGGGAFAFLVGIGCFEQTGFVVRQYFLREPGEEKAMLGLLGSLLSAGGALVTFNGRTFDVPLLTGRLVMSRRSPAISSLPNLDLLHPARRLWRRRLDSCALGSLESEILGVHRTHNDVPGSLIPYLYRRYLETRNACDMVRVLYHNEIDLLSMVSLGVRLAAAFARPDRPGMPGDDRLSLARWFEGQGRTAEAQAAYQAVLDEAGDSEIRYDALVGLAYLFKRTEHREEAVPLWTDVAGLRQDILGHEELAKHFEWYGIDLEKALAWTEAGLTLAESWRPGWRRTEALRTLQHRRERLLRKLRNNQSSEAG
jgi:hypothetical protein